MVHNDLQNSTLFKTQPYDEIINTKSVCETNKLLNNI